MTDFSYKSYSSLLKTIVQSGRVIRSFEQADGVEQPLVILRHDIDFSLHKAVDMARLDAAAGATSTYFVLLTAPYYNPLSEEGAKLLREISAMGHEIGLHYDCTGFEELSGEQRQKRIFALACALANVVGRPIGTIAQHKPAKSPIRQQFPPFRDAYNDAYVKDIPYISDSRRIFLYHGDVPGFIAQHHKCQLLTHPIWWNEEPLERGEIFKRLGMAMSDSIASQLADEEASISAFLEARKHAQ